MSFWRAISVLYWMNTVVQVGSKSTTTRAQIRHHLYVAELKPEAALAPELKEKLLQIADLIHSNRPRAADYELQLIIRDYGPYVIKSVVAGGVFEQETQVQYVDGLITSKYPWACWTSSVQ